jgi:glycosyltransferase involved in cell wall biosynthesis
VPEISLIIPTRNEAETICECIQKAQLVFAKSGLVGEVIVSDSSSDQTPNIAASSGARVIRPEKLGYGNAYLAGFGEAQGDYVVLMDGDLTYDPEAIQDMLVLLKSGNYDMVDAMKALGSFDSVSKKPLPPPRSVHSPSTFAPSLRAIPFSIRLFSSSFLCPGSHV